MKTKNPFKNLDHTNHQVPDDLKMKVINAVAKVKKQIEKNSSFAKKQKNNIVSLFKTKN